MRIMRSDGEVICLECREKIPKVENYLQLGNVICIIDNCKKCGKKKIDAELAELNERAKKSN
jgi:hypothetical protein